EIRAALRLVDGDRDVHAGTTNIKENSATAGYLHFETPSGPCHANARCYVLDTMQRYRSKQQTLLDPYEIRGYRSKQQTLHDAYELPLRDEDLGDWEEPTPDLCKVVVERSPRGIRYESWLRARSWGADL